MWWSFLYIYVHATMMRWLIGITKVLYCFSIENKTESHRAYWWSSQFHQSSSGTKRLFHVFNVSTQQINGNSVIQYIIFSSSKESSWFFYMFVVILSRNGKRKFWMRVAHNICMFVYNKWWKDIVTDECGHRDWLEKAEFTSAASLWSMFPLIIDINTNEYHLNFSEYNGG